MKKILIAIVFYLSMSLLYTSTHAAILPPPYDKTEAQINGAFNELYHLSKTEKKNRISNVKTVIKQYKTNLKNGAKIDDNKLLAIIFAILIPPVGVLLHKNGITTKFWISLLLSSVFLFPGLGFLYTSLGVIYSLLVVTDNI